MCVSDNMERVRGVFRIICLKLPYPKFLIERFDCFVIFWKYYGQVSKKWPGSMLAKALIVRLDY